MKCRNKKWAKNGRALDFWIRFSAIFIKKNALFHWRCNPKSKIWSKIGTNIIFFPVKAEISYFRNVIIGGPKWGPWGRYFGIKNRLSSENEVKNHVLLRFWGCRPPFRPPFKYQESDPMIFSLWKRIWTHFQIRPWLQNLEKHDFSRFLGLWEHFRAP